MATLTVFPENFYSLKKKKNTFQIIKNFFSDFFLFPFFSCEALCVAFFLNCMTGVTQTKPELRLVPRSALNITVLNDGEPA